MEVRVGMPGMQDLGRMLLVMGGVIVFLGLLLTFGGKLPLFGRLPGDISIQRENLSCTFPMATCILLSVILTVLINVVLRLLRK
jgi:hypothetical protein